MWVCVCGRADVCECVLKQSVNVIEKERIGRVLNEKTSISFRSSQNCYPLILT